MNTTDMLPVLRCVQAPPPFPDATDAPDAGGKKGIPASSPRPGGETKPDANPKTPPTSPSKPKSGSSLSN